MEGGREVKIILFSLHFFHLLAFVLMITSICTSSWYTTHLLISKEGESERSFGLLGSCEKIKDACFTRNEILQFNGKVWPFSPLKANDFDWALLMFILGGLCSIVSIALTLYLLADAYNRKRWLEWLLVVASVITGILLCKTILLKSMVLPVQIFSGVSAALGLTSIIVLDQHVRSNDTSTSKFRHGWSSYVTWLSVGISTLVIFPAIYLLQLKPKKMTSCECRRRCRNPNDRLLLRYEHQEGYC